MTDPESLIEQIKQAGQEASERMYFGDLSYPVKAIPYSRFLEILGVFVATYRAEVRAGVVVEEPEWETECVEEARIHYRYGVNSGTLAAWNTPESIALAVEDHERRTMGRIGVEKVETRTKITRTSPWVPVKQEGQSAKHEMERHRD